MIDCRVATYVRSEVDALLVRGAEGDAGLSRETEVEFSTLSSALSFHASRVCAASGTLGVTVGTLRDGGDEGGRRGSVSPEK